MIHRIEVILMMRVIETIVVGFIMLLSLGFCVGACWLSWKKSEARKQMWDREINVICKPVEPEPVPRCECINTVRHAEET